MIRESSNLGASVELNPLDDAHIDELISQLRIPALEDLSLYQATITPYSDISHEIGALQALDRRKPIAYSWS